MKTNWRDVKLYVPLPVKITWNANLHALYVLSVFQVAKKRCDNNRSCARCIRLLDTKASGSGSTLLHIAGLPPRDLRLDEIRAGSATTRYRICIPVHSVHIYKNGMRMCMCMYVYVCVCMYVYMYVCMYICAYICMLYVWIYMNVSRMCTCVFVWVCIYVYIFATKMVCVYVYMCMCMYVCMYICVYICTLTYMYCIYVYVCV